MGGGAATGVFAEQVIQYVHGKQIFTPFYFLTFGPSKVNRAKYAVIAIFVIWLTKMKKMVVLKFST